MRTLVARAYLGAGIGLMALYVAIGGSKWIYEAFGLGATLAIVCGTLMYARGAARAGWLVFATGQALLATGDLVYFNAYGAVTPFPSVADGFYLAGMIVIGIALLVLIAQTGAARDFASFADATVLAFGCAVLAWAAFFHGGLGSGADLAKVVSVAYPVLDLAVAIVLIRMFFVPGVRERSYSLLCGSIALLVFADLWYVVPSLSDSYQLGSWEDCGWLGAYLLAGLAALQPSMRSIVAVRPGTLNVRRVLLLGLSLGAIVVSPGVQYAVDRIVHPYVLAIGGFVVASFVVYRVTGLIHTLEAATRAAREAERRFRMVFERAPIGISVGRDGVMSETNPALQRMLGYSAEEFARMHYTDVTHHDDLDLWEQRELDEAKRDSVSLDKRYVRKDGGTIDAHVHLALDAEDGLGISLIEDVTQRHELEERLRQSQKMEAIGKLAAGVAHDFNNLMTAVIGYSDLLATEVDDVSRTKVDGIRDSALRASDLTRQLLAFGRKQMLRVTVVDLRDVVSRMDSLLRRVIGEDIRLETFFGSESILVRADTTQLEQVVLNLVSNARDAMPTGGTVVVAVVSDGEHATLSVMDTGSGIDLEVQKRIFEPFFTTKAFGDSAGLGLSTVYGIVGQSGGSITLESAPGAGSSFYVRLPLAPAVDALPEELPAATLVD